MNIKKDKEKKIHQTYDKWLHAYLNADVSTYDYYLDKDYHFVGSTDNEEFLNKTKTTDFFRLTGEQLAGKTDLKNEIKIIEEFNDLIFFTHFFDAWFLNEEDWSYYGRFRCSSVMKETETGWKFIYQHFSMPDAKSDEGQTIGYDNMKSENRELKEAIKRRTHELEIKNRALEVENALTQIRAEAMAMNTSGDLLDIVVTMRNEFIKLGHDAQYFWHMMWLPDSYEKAMTSGDGSRIGFVMELPRHVHGDIPPLAKWEKSQEATVVYAMNTQEAIAYVDKMIDLGNFQNIDPQAPSHDDIRAIGGLTFIMARTSHGEIGYSLLGVVKNPPKEDLAILVQFAGAFDLAHRRFLDLQKAEAQARESQIIAALERVRAATMAMHQSDELSNVLSTLFGLYDILGINPSHAVLTLINKEKNTLTYRTTGKNGYKVYAEQEVDLNVYDSWVDTTEKWKKSKPNTVNVNEYPPEILPDVWGVYKEVLEAMPKKDRPEIKDFPDGLFITEGYCQFGYIGFANNRRPTEEEQDIVRRFATEFSTLYQRFLDLQKAEEQAREAQIEAALERVRAKAMSMQSSDELDEVLSVLCEQFDVLGILPMSTHMTVFDFEHNTFTFRETGKYGNRSFGEQTVELDAMDNWKETIEKWKADKASAINKLHFPKEQLPEVWEVFHESFASMPETSRIIPEDYPDGIYHTAGKHPFGYIGMNQVRPATKEEEQIVIKFASEFGRAYQRFLDLQKAEAQAREAKIEAALERVRSRSMAMHNSAELSEVVDTLQKEFTNLDFNLTFCIINLINEEDLSNTVWAAHPETGKQPESYDMKFEDYPFHHAMWDAWKAQKKRSVYVLEGEEKKIYDQYLYHETEFSRFPEHVKKANTDLEHYTTGFTFFKYSGLQTVSETEISEEDLAILERFGRVFEQAYTRFLDLKKAELQAREAKIENALEKIRSRTMAMQKGEELMDVVVLLYKELIALGVTNFVTCGYVEISESAGKQSTWVTHPGGDSLALFYLPLEGDDTFDERYKAWINQEEVFHQTVAGNVRKSHLDYAITTFNSKEAEEMVLSQFPDPTVFYCFNFSHGYLHIVAGSLLNNEEEALMARFTKVFEQTYARFLDLKKAELQAREAQINLAVERVRAKALAMHKSEEIMEVVAKLKEEVMGLDIPGVVASSIFLEAGNDRIRMWDLSSLEQSDKDYQAISDITFQLKKEDPHLYIKRVWENPEDYFVEEQDAKDLERIIEFMYKNNQEEIAREVEDYTRTTNLKELYHASKRLNNGKLCIDLLEPPPAEMEGILHKVGAAFDLAYKRFEDLQKAEQQTREAQIETALEKVRSRTMAMQKSEELPEAANTLFLEVQALGIPAWSAGYNILSEDKTHSTCIMSSQGEIQSPFTLPLTEHSSLKPWYEALVNEEDFFIHGQEGQDLIEHYNYLTSLPELQSLLKQFKDAGIELPLKQYNHLVRFSQGFLLFITYKEVPESHAIFKRFGKVFEQTYTRFLDLQKAEEREKEAIKQASLDRVRGEIASMRKTKDLERITPLIWKELTTLGVPFFRCGVFIIREDEQMVHAYLSKPDGASVAALHIPFSDKDNKLIKPTLENWRLQQVYKESWNQDQFVQQTHMFLKKGQIENPEAYDISETPPEQLVLHLIPFKQGMVYVGNVEDLTEDEINLVESLSTAFSVAYSRYEDFKALETAKNSLELTINDLKSTQAQLIQSEKMASLGELTAGIAHEIQNPLNFVNNFSELNKELVQEAKEELAKGDLEETKAILNDLEGNSEKINHHGKRADAIVKGMLAHSRSSSGEKIPTDINALADEYLRLSYHGLRARDKTFNADYKTDFDPNLPKVNVVSQDIGRVLLNLINNAFQAVHERGKKGESGYKPEVFVETKLTTKNIALITIRDNGLGIPDFIKEKIFQPFFTTKPTGHGTGLGLSLSYDIVKAHGGEIRVESKQGEETSFIISLPFKINHIT